MNRASFAVAKQQLIIELTYNIIKKCAAAAAAAPMAGSNKKSLLEPHRRNLFRTSFRRFL